MPLNAGPEFERAMEKYSSARTPREKIAALKEALTYLPKHKGTEKTRAFLMRRLAELKRTLEKEGKKSTGRSVLVQKEGFQVVLFGFPNSGKSYILKHTTNARVSDSPVPLSTTEPVPGMMHAGGGRIQLVEVPSYFPGYGESRIGRIGLTTIRSADAVALVLDLSADPLNQYSELVSFLRSESIYPNASPPGVKIERTHSGGINITGAKLPDEKRAALIETLHAHGIYNANVVIYSDFSAQDFELALNESARFPRAVVIGNKPCREGIEALNRIPDVEKVIFSDANAFKEELFVKLGLIRVFTKPPKGEVSKEAVVLRRGATVQEIVRKLGNKPIRFAKLWRKGVFERRTVGLDFVLEDGDIIELH